MNATKPFISCPARGQGGTRRQRGFTLIEMSIVLVLMAMTISTFILLQAQQAADNRARAVAQTYTRMNQAVGGYLQTYYKQLITVPPECSRVNWAANSGAGAITPNYSGCGLSLSLNGGPATPVVNALQPTPLELARLGFLEGGSAYQDSLPLPTLRAGNSNFAFTTGNWLVGNAAGVLPVRFMVLVQFMCINGGTVSQFNTTGACGSGTIDLRSLVFNSQPFSVQAADPGSGVLYQALQAMGADGYLSGPGPGTNTPTQDTGELRSIRGAAEPSLSNPTRMVSGNAGAPFILAMRNGYGTADWSLFKKMVEDLQRKVDSISANDDFVHLFIRPCRWGDMKITYETFLNGVKRRQSLTANFNIPCEFGSVGSGDGMVVTDLPYDSWTPMVTDNSGVFESGFTFANPARRKTWAFRMYGQQNGGWTQFAHITFKRTGNDTTATDLVLGYPWYALVPYTPTADIWFLEGQWR